MEGADPIVSPAQAQLWWDRGLRCVGLAHYGPHPYAFVTGSSGPVTPGGRALLKEFERLGMIADLTHTSEPGFFETLELFGGRVLASHNMCRAIAPGDRQFSDEQLRALVDREAIIGMAFDAWMLVPSYRAGQMPRVGFAPSGGIGLAVELVLALAIGVHAAASPAPTSTKKRRRPSVLVTFGPTAGPCPDRTMEPCRSIS